MNHLLSASAISDRAKHLFREEREMGQLTGWFTVKQIQKRHEAETKHLPPMEAAAVALRHVAHELPISLSDHAIFAGTQRDAFASSYALINPAFQVETFAGYCDPTEVFDYIKPTDNISAEEIAEIREYVRISPYGKALSETYAAVENDTAEVAYFIEQVTGHVIPDLRRFLANGLEPAIAEARNKAAAAESEALHSNYRAMAISLEAVLVLAERYRVLALEKAATASGEQRAVWESMAATLQKVPAKGADTLYEAIQSFLLLWQAICVEQAPNPFAMSVGNADRIFEPYRAKENLSREDTAALLKHLLVFYNVGDRSWAISQNLIIGGKLPDGSDLTNPTSYALLDAYYDMMLPQPILSVKLHNGTPEKLYEEMGRFFFTPGQLTPSLFNDESVFQVLQKAGVQPEDLADYSIAGCQEPLIMGQDNGNTTNSWLNLAKILELTLNEGVSSITGKRIGTYAAPAASPLELLQTVRQRFAVNLEAYADRMVAAANNASRAVSLLPVPLLSTAMGGLETGYDMRDPSHQGTKYNGSGCLIHGSSVVADSFVAIDCLLQDRPQDAGRLLEALKNNFADAEDLRQYLLTCPKFGNNDAAADQEVVALLNQVTELLSSKKNYLGNPFRPDYSSPSTHLLYGYWVGATPDGRKAREMLNYGVDPLFGDASNGLGFRTLSTRKLPFEGMCGGYASHFGIDPKYFTSPTMEGKGLDFANHILKPLFFGKDKAVNPFYLYVNVTTADILRKVLADPKKYAPSGVYIMRIHGTFVNFLDLSPAIQQDIITRLDPGSTALC